MDQIKIGELLKSLRKEKGITQEELAERFGVNRRTVSRWESGNNLPDISLLPELADFYEVDLREILDGERKNKKMDQELKETVNKVAEYSNLQNKKEKKLVLAYLIFGMIGTIGNGVLYFVDLKQDFWNGFLEGLFTAMTFLAILFGILYVTGTLEKLMKKKRKILGMN